MSIAITGSTGHLGRLVIDRLKARGMTGDLIALARSPEKAARLGVTVREADYAKPETLGPAFDGVDTLLLISASDIGKRADQHRNIINAAKEAGVGWIIYTSILHADTSPIDLAEEHRATEAMLKESGIPLTLLRNGWYTENHTAAVPAAVAHGVLVGSAGDGKISWATRADFADAAVVVLTGEGHAGKTYELAGDDAWTLPDLAAQIAIQSRREIEYRNLPEAEYAAALVQFGLPEWLAKRAAGWDACASKDALFDDGRQLSALIGRPTTPLADAVTDALHRCG